MGIIKVVIDGLTNLVAVPESWYHELSPDYETKVVLQAHGETPNERAAIEGEGWKADWVDYDSGVMTIYRKKERK